MTSTEKQIKKSTKFNYLTANTMKQELLGKYETLNFSPPECKRSYDVPKIQKNKQNLKGNQNQDYIDESDHFMKNDSIQFNQKYGSLNNRLISFRKSPPRQANSKFEKQNQNSKDFNESGILDERTVQRKGQNVQRARNKSFGNISYKKAHIEANLNFSGKKNSGQFSPYQEEKRIKQRLLNDEHPSSKLKSIDVQRLQQNKAYIKPQQKLLIYELEEQQNIIKRQLTQYEYQNQLLRQKIEYLQSDNILLKEDNEKYRQEVQEQKIYYQQLLNTQSVNIAQLHEEIQIVSDKNQQYQIIIDEDKFFIHDLQQEAEMLHSKVNEIQILLDSKQRLIKQLQNQIELFQMTQKDNLSFESQHCQRRKSLDFPTQMRKSPIQEYSSVHNFNLTHCPPIHGFRSSGNEKMGTKMQDSKILQKNLNFIESIKSMYIKITNKQAKDLKQLWKWLKFMAHQYQSFSQLYNLRDSILIVLDDLKTRNALDQSERQLSFMDKQYYKIIKKLAGIVMKQCQN